MTKETPIAKLLRKYRKINPKRWKDGSYHSFTEVEKTFGSLDAMTWIKGRKFDKQKRIVN